MWETLYTSHCFMCLADALHCTFRDLNPWPLAFKHHEYSLLYSKKCWVIFSIQHFHMFWGMAAGHFIASSINRSVPQRHYRFTPLLCHMPSVLSQILSLQWLHHWSRWTAGLTVGRLLIIHYKSTNYKVAIQIGFICICVTSGAWCCMAKFSPLDKSVCLITKWMADSLAR